MKKLTTLILSLFVLSFVISSCASKKKTIGCPSMIGNTKSNLKTINS